jgi:hypothetical protein
VSRIEQRGAAAFRCRDGRGGDPADYAVGLCVLEDDAGVLFGQP